MEGRGRGLIDTNVRVKRGLYSSSNRSSNRWVRCSVVPKWRKKLSARIAPVRPLSRRNTLGGQACGAMEILRRDTNQPRPVQLAIVHRGGTGEHCKWSSEIDAQKTADQAWHFVMNLRPDGKVAEFHVGGQEDRANRLPVVLRLICQRAGQVACGERLAARRLQANGMDQQMPIAQGILLPGARVGLPGAVPSRELRVGRSSHPPKPRKRTP